MRGNSSSRNMRRLIMGLIILGLFAYRKWQDQHAPIQPAQTSSQRSHQSSGRASTSQPNDSSAPENQIPTAQNSNDGNMLLGNPSGAATDSNNFLLERPQYSLSYNRSRGGANWVAWHTDASDLGRVARGRFRPDPTLPKAWQITPNDYNNSGYDRGHLCPSADRSNTRKNNDATFYMSNMVPQTAQLNQHIWADMEDAVRGLVKQGNEVYQVAGGAGDNGRIGSDKVAVPASCWKIVVALPLGTGDAARINANTQVWAVIIPNTTDPSLETADWRTYQTSVKKIEVATRFDFFNGLAPNVKAALEKKGN